jgi:hypothetical protein
MGATVASERIGPQTTSPPSTPSALTAAREPDLTRARCLPMLDFQRARRGMTWGSFQF